MKSAFEWVRCPTCDIEYAHVQPAATKVGEGIKSFGRADERSGVRVLLVCENLHPFFVGIGEHKGSIGVYVREALPGETALVHNPALDAVNGYEPFVVIGNEHPMIEYNDNASTFQELFA